MITISLKKLENNSLAEISKIPKSNTTTPNTRIHKKNPLIINESKCRNAIPNDNAYRESKSSLALTDQFQKL